MKPLIHRYFKGTKTIPPGVYMVYVTEVTKAKLIRGKIQWVHSHYAFYINIKNKYRRVKEHMFSAIPAGQTIFIPD